MNQTYLKLYTIKTKLYSHARHIFVHDIHLKYVFFFLEFNQLSASFSSFFQILICHRSITFLMDIAAYSV